MIAVSFANQMSDMASSRMFIPLIIFSPRYALSALSIHDDRVQLSSRGSVIEKTLISNVGKLIYPKSAKSS